MGNIEGLDRAVAQFEKQAYDQSEGNNVRFAITLQLRFLQVCLSRAHGPHVCPWSPWMDIQTQPLCGMYEVLVPCRDAVQP